MPPAIVLYEPEIPPNTGNIIRLAANTGCELHLIRPLGFELDDRRLRRAGLDYHEFSRLVVHESWDSFLQAMGPRRLLACSTRGSVPYTSVQFSDEDCLVFGPETRGLPQALLVSGAFTATLHIPMRPGSRSLNLSNAAAVIVYEAWRQLGYQ